MTYYIFRVQDSLKKEYYIVNNVYIGYINFDGDSIRSGAEYANNVKRKYQLYAKGELYGEPSAQMHELFSNDARLTKEQSDELIDRYCIYRSRDNSYYEIKHKQNSSECWLEEIEGKNKKTIK